MSALRIADLSGEEAVLIGRYTYRVFADLRRLVGQGGALTQDTLQQAENMLISELTTQLREVSKNSVQLRGPLA